MGSNIGRSIEPSHIEKRVYELEKNSKSASSSLKKKEFVFDSIEDISYWDATAGSTTKGDFVLKKKISVGIDDNKIIKASFYQRNKVTGEKALDSKFTIGGVFIPISKELDIDIVRINDFDYEDLVNKTTATMPRTELFIFMPSLYYYNKGAFYYTKPIGFKIINGDLLLLAQKEQSSNPIFAGGPTEDLYVLDPDYELVVEISYIE